MKIYIVWEGDGYGHTTLVCITACEERADELAEANGAFVAEETLEDLGKGIMLLVVQASKYKTI